MANDIQKQWANPSDILSLLLLVGGDIVQKAIAQMVGHVIAIPSRPHIRLHIAPVAFSFGCVAYGFTNLLAAVGDMKLMPAPDHRSLTINCATGFARETNSWVLGRLLRDHKLRHPVDARSIEEGGRAECVRIDTFYLKPVLNPSFDLVWWSGWCTLFTQLVISIIPGVVEGDWRIMLVTVSGVFLIAVTCAMPQWTEEKWTGRTLQKEKVICLTSGNGSHHILVLIGLQGSWDLETLAVGMSRPRAETRWLSLILAILWICLLLTIPGLQEHTWSLIVIGGLGMLQNVFAAGTGRMPCSSNFHITPFSSAPTIIGRRQPYQDAEDGHACLPVHDAELAGVKNWLAAREKAQRQPRSTSFVQPEQMPPWLATMSKEDGVPPWLETIRPVVGNRESPPSGSTMCKRSKFISGVWRWLQLDEPKPCDVVYAIGVHGALRELEKWVPTAGLAMVQIFFPGGLVFNEASIRDNIDKRFWKTAYHTVAIRKKAAETSQVKKSRQQP